MAAARRDEEIKEEENSEDLSESGAVEQQRTSPDSKKQTRLGERKKNASKS